MSERTSQSVTCPGALRSSQCQGAIRCSGESRPSGLAPRELAELGADREIASGQTAQCGAGRFLRRNEFKMQFSATQVFGRQLTILSAFCVVSVVVVVDPVGRVSAWRTRSPRAMSCSRSSHHWELGTWWSVERKNRCRSTARAALQANPDSGRCWGRRWDTTLLEAELNSRPTAANGDC